MMKAMRRRIALQSTSRTRAGRQCEIHSKPITVSRKLATGRVRPTGGLSECARVSASLFGVGHVGGHPSRGDGLKAIVKGNT